MTQAAPTPPVSTDQACPSCGTANRAGTRFCSACGTALAAGSAVPPQSPPQSPAQSPVMPPMAPPLSRGSGFGGAGFGQMSTDTHVTVALEGAQAHAHAQQVLTQMGAEIVASNPPSTLSAIIPYKGMGKPVKFRCQMVIQPTAPGQSRIAYGIKVDWNSTFMVVSMISALAVFNILFAAPYIGLLAPLFSILGVGWMVYDYHTGIPGRIGRKLGQKLSSAPSGPIAPTPQPPVHAPVPPTPVPPTPVPHTPVAQATAPTQSQDHAADVIARIEKLAALRDKGLLTPEEFEQRRTDLLDRL